MNKHTDEAQLCNVFTDITRDICNINHLNGWYDKNMESGTGVALIHSECSELLEALRKEGMQSEHLEGYSAAAEELADIIIRVFDFAYRFGHEEELAPALLAKLEYNATRGYRHGNKSF